MKWKSNEKKINKAKIWFFGMEKWKKNDKLPISAMKRRLSPEILWILKVYHEPLYTGKLGHLHEVDKFINKFNLPKLTRNMNSLVEIELINFPERTLETRFHWWILSNIQRKNITNLIQFFSENSGWRNCWEYNIPKPDETLQKQILQTNIMNIDAEVLNEIVVNWIQQYIKEYIIIK